MNNTAIKPRWELGKIVATPDAITRMNSGRLSAMEILARHSACDFSECNPEDAKLNTKRYRMAQGCSTYSKLTCLKLYG